MNLPNLKEAKVRTKNKVDIVNNAYNIPEEVKNIGKNKTYHIITYGCQMNVHDSENISAIMEDLGYTRNEIIVSSNQYPSGNCNLSKSEAL